MKKNALVVLGLLVSLVSAGAVVGKNLSPKTNNVVIAKQAKITVEQARKIALKKVDGKIEEEFTIEDDDENITTYIFVIKDKKGKTFEVQIDAENGAVLSSEEVTEDDDDESEPPAVETESSEAEIVEIAEVEATETESEEPDEAVEVIEPKVSIEQARAAALITAKGEIQSEELINEDGQMFYSFIIQDPEYKMIEIRVDANSGKAQIVKKADTE